MAAICFDLDALTQAHDEPVPVWGKFVTKIHIFENTIENSRGAFVLIYNMGICAQEYAL